MEGPNVFRFFFWKGIGMRKFLAVVLTIMALCWHQQEGTVRPETAPGGDNGRPAQDSGLGRDISIAELVSHAYDHNPDILAAREAWKAVVARQGLVTALPDPQLSFTYFPDPIETRLGPQDWNVTISQSIPFPGKLAKAGDVAAAEARIARLNLDRTVRDVAADICRSYHELLYIQEARRIARRNADLLDDLRKIGENFYAQDRAAFFDVVKAQSQVAQVGYDILLLDELEMTEKTRLNGLLNRPPDAPLGDAPPVPVRPVAYEIDELYELAEAHREEIRMAEANMKKADAQVDLAKYEVLPDFKVGLFYAGVGDPDVPVPPEDAGDDSYGVQLSMSIPLWFGKNDSRKESAMALAQKARAEKAGRVNETNTRIRTLYFQLSNSRRLISLYRDQMIPQALKAVETAETWFREREGSFADFVETQKTAYNFQLALARATADYGKTLAELERVAGMKITERSGEPSSEKGGRP